MARKTEKAEAIDRHIGRRIKLQRERLGMTQAELAQDAGVSYQQIHKYERGANRISAGRLWLIAAVLQMPVQQFYAALLAPAALPVAQDESEDGRIAFEMARYFRRIANPRHQEAVHQLVRMLAR